MFPRPAGQKGQGFLKQVRPPCGGRAGPNAVPRPVSGPASQALGRMAGLFFNGTGKNAVRNVPQNDRKGGKDSEAYLLECKWLSRRAEQGF